MKNFLRRLKFYGIGFGIGIVFVLFFFQNRGCTWLPSNRVKNTILGRVLVIEDQQAALMKKHGISAKDAVAFLDDGDIAFGESKKAGNPQVYSIRKEINGKEVELWFTLPDDSYISEIQWPTGSVQKAGNSAEGMGRMVHFPNVKSIVYLDDNKPFLCQQDKTRLISTKEVQKRMQLTGKIDFGRSDFDQKPQAQQYVLFTSPNGMKIEAKTVWFQEHIRFKRFILQDSIPCP